MVEIVNTSEEFRRSQRAISFLIAFTLCFGIGWSWLLGRSLTKQEPTVVPFIVHSIPPIATRFRDETNVFSSTHHVSVSLLVTTSMVHPTPIPEIVEYRAHVVADGETLETIAAQGGSDEDLLRTYNKLGDTLASGSPLIVPTIKGRTNMLSLGPIIVRKGRPDRPRVAITFDDCPSNQRNMERILGALRDRNIHITFFVMGSRMHALPDQTRQMVADGHEFGNHSNSHAFFSRLNNEAIIDELAETERLLQEIGNATTRPYFRPPYGDYNQRVLLAAIGQGYLPVYWSIDSRDAVGYPKNQEYLLKNTVNLIPAEKLHGAIILFHCTSSTTADSLAVILDRFAQLGLEVCPLSNVIQ